MRFVRGLSLGQRFLVAPLLGVVVCGAVTAAFYYESRRQDELLARVTERDLKAFNHYAEVFIGLTEEHTALFELLHGAPGRMNEEAIYERAKLHLLNVQHAVSGLAQALPPADPATVPAFAALLERLSASAQAYRKGVGAAVGMATLDAALGPDQVALSNERFVAMNRDLVSLLELERATISAEVDSRLQHSEASRRAIAVSGVTVAALLLLLSVFLARTLSHSMETQIARLAELGAQAGAAPGEHGSEEDRMSRAVAAFAHSLTDLRESERRLKRLNRVYAVLSGINALIVRVGERDELYREACDIAVEHGGFRAAAIAMVDAPASRLRLAASAGAPEAFLAAIRPRLSLDPDAPEGPGPVGLAIAGRKAVVVNDVDVDPRVLRKSECREHGVLSLAVMPLLVSGEAVGVFALFGAEKGLFDEGEMALLTGLAGDIAFATDHIAKAARLDYLAYYDALTGLANRGLLLERVGQSIRGAAAAGDKLALALLDVERFKNINDSLGRPAGDELLLQVGEWLARRMGDASLAARVGADHFAVVITGIADQAGAARLAEEMMEAFASHPFRLDGAVFRITARVGIAMYPDDGADADTVFRNAEAALKQAKARGDRYLYHAHRMTEAVAGKVSLENQLRQALEREEFVLHYQPKVSLATGKVTGVEALIRWNDPRSGLVLPGKFIGVLEEIGLIGAVGRWTLRQALADHLAWRAAGLDAPRIAVNVSPLQLRGRSFIAEIAHAIGVDPAAPAGLELEIMESVVMDDARRSIATLQAIREMGVTLAIDDFGTGSSSLSHLAKLPVHALKIDRSFVVDMTAGPEGLALVSTIIKLAHSLRMGAVAEGVETEDQSRLLRLLGCDEMQGYLVSRPEPAAAFASRFLAPGADRSPVPRAA
jgi:diguanylate cyclase (GGDEF)-like protein